MNKLYQMQAKIGVLTKDTTNEFYNCKYFDINKMIKVLKPLMEEFGIAITQPLQFIDGRTVLATYITDIESGKVLLESKIALPDINEPQKVGSSITYYRRYTLTTMFFLEAEDDDANSTVPKKVPVSNADYDHTPPPTENFAPVKPVLTNCDNCKSTNIKNIVGVSKKTGVPKPYDFWACQEKACGHKMNP